MNSNNTFVELQTLWVSREADTNLNQGKISQSDSLVKKLKNLQTFQNKVNKIKLSVISLIFISIIFILYNSQSSEPLAYIGLLIVFISTLLFFSYYLKNQFRLSRLDFSNPSPIFLETAIAQLHKQNAIFRGPFTYFSLAMLVGINIMFLGVLSEGTFSERFQIHSTFSLWVMLASLIGGRIRQRRIKKEVLPIIVELERVKNNLTEESH